ncbi:hypothetical protein M9Y10_038420 [Tritrichomonas musculus]|uniref:Uncharacterized protein n=1 Tax=Tritrichomonas musculus TaxID=1915356 RepID=A0ABR2K8F6_9EUKA
MNSDFDYELSDDCEEDSHVQDVPVPAPKDIDIVLTPATAKKYLVDGEPLPEEIIKEHLRPSLANNLRSKEECELSDDDFAESEESLHDHENNRGNIVEANENEEYITPPEIKGKFYNMANSIPQNVLLRMGEPSLSERPANDPVRQRVTATVLAAFAVASYKTLWPNRFEELRQQYA